MCDKVPWPKINVNCGIQKYFSSKKKILVTVTYYIVHTDGYCSSKDHWKGTVVSWLNKSAFGHFLYTKNATETTSADHQLTKVQSQTVTMIQIIFEINNTLLLSCSSKTHCTKHDHRTTMTANQRHLQIAAFLLCTMYNTCKTTTVYSTFKCKTLVQFTHKKP